MVVNWNDKSVQDRLLTAMIASVDNKINISEIARLYGGGGDMTYHALENHLRSFKREAKNMKAAAEGRESAAPSPARPKSTKKAAGSGSPMKAAGGVKGGRVSKKKAPATATKVKKEIIEESEGEGEEMGMGRGFGEVRDEMDGMEYGDMDEDLELGEV